MLLPAFGLVLARVGGLVFALPLLTSRQVPRMVKVWLVVTLSLLAFPVVAPLLPHSLSLGQAAVGMVGEFVVGEILGLGAGLIFLSVQVAGKVVSHQSGMALGQAYNPVMDAPSTVLDQVWFFGVLMLFLAMGGHLAVIKVLLGSFEQVPAMLMVFDGSVGEFVIGILRSSFDVALRMCGPVVLALLLTSLIMGFLTKTMPQLNILSVGFSFKIVTAWFILAITISFSDGVIADGIADGLDQIGLLFEHLTEVVVYAG